MLKQEEILVTGGNGLLCGEIKKLWPRAIFTDLPEFDITDFNKMRQYINGKGIKLIFHAAAFTSPPLNEKDPAKAVEVNIIGTANVVNLCMRDNIKMVYVSTDYVFKGDKGNYKEEDPVCPVNKYAWSKLGGECSVRLYDNSLIIRTTFGPNVFPYEKAFSDQWTSRESVSEIAKRIVKLVEKDATGVVHVGGKRKTVYRYARSLDKKKKIGKISIKDATFRVPKDTSLNTDKYDLLIK